MKILIADDNSLNRKYLRILLTQEAHTVVEREDGLAALEELQGDKIWVESEEGKGTMFAFTLPVNDNVDQENNTVHLAALG